MEIWEITAIKQSNRVRVEYEKYMVYTLYIRSILDIDDKLKKFCLVQMGCFSVSDAGWSLNVLNDHTKPTKSQRVILFV